MAGRIRIRLKAFDHAVIDAAAGYLRHYQQQLTSVMASEVYTQRVLAQVPRDRAMPMRRTLKSDIFFMFAPGHAWRAIREVIEMYDAMPDGNARQLKRLLEILADKRSNMERQLEDIRLMQRELDDVEMRAREVLERLDQS